MTIEKEKNAERFASGDSSFFSLCSIAKINKNTTINKPKYVGLGTSKSQPFHAIDINPNQNNSTM